MTFRYCDETALGFSWVAGEPMTRASHALVADGRVWLVDPVDWPEAIERARSLGEPDRKSTRLNSSHIQKTRMPSSA